MLPQVIHVVERRSSHVSSYSAASVPDNGGSVSNSLR